MHACSNLYLIILNLWKHYTSKNVDGNFVYCITGYIHSNLDIFSPASWQLSYTCLHAKKNSAQYFTYHFFTERILKLEKGTNIPYLRQMPQHCLNKGSRDSVVSIATRYGLEGPGIESRWGEIFRTYPDRLRGPPSLLYNGYRVFPGGKDGRGVMLTTHPLLVPRLRKSWAIPPLTLWVLLGLLRGSLYGFHLLFFIYYLSCNNFFFPSRNSPISFSNIHKHAPNKLLILWSQECELN